jgi:hypothetical protein
MMLREWWRSLDSVEVKLLLFIAVALLGYLAIWILYFLGFFPQLVGPTTQ